MYSDFHLHSHHSADSEESCQAIIERCISLGMESCCFTDHNDFYWPIDGEDYTINPITYFNELLPLKEKYKNAININIGVECGIAPTVSDLNNAFVNNNPFDFVIASCHIVDDKDPYYPDFFTDIDDREAFESYFKALVSGYKTFNNFDVLGHLDYIVRYSPNKEQNYTPSDYSDMIDFLLKGVIDLGKGIEINTSGLKSGLSFANPCIEILKRYKELGGEIITIGSDAHTCQYLGYRFDKAGEFLKGAGFKYYCHFSNRQASFHSL